MTQQGSNSLKEQLLIKKAKALDIVSKVFVLFVNFKIITGARAKARVAIFLSLLTLLLSLPFFPLTAHLSPLKSNIAQAATSNQLNFQGRLLNSSGNLVADGIYNMQFDIYYVSSGGSTQWTEDRLVTNTQGVTVKNGYYSVYLGEYDSFPALDWGQDLYLGMTVRGTASCAWGSCSPADSEMTPRFKLTSVPYAFRSANVASSATNAASTHSDAVSVTTGNALGATSNSGNLTISTGSGTSNSGNIILDVGNGTGTDGTISLGSVNASALTLGRSGLTTTNAGALTVTQLLTGNLGATISGAAINLNASSNFATNINTGTSSGTITLGGGSSPLAINSTAFDVSTAGALSGITTISTSSTINSQTISSTANFTGTLAVNGASVTVGTASTTNGTLRLLNSSNAFGVTISAANQTVGNATVVFPNTAGAGDTLCLLTLANCGSNMTIGALNGGTPNANGATISSGVLYLQSASASNAGLVDTTTQTFAGAKTFSSAISAPTSSNTINGLIVNAGALSGVTGYAQTSGNFSQSGAGTFGTGTGAVSLNGNTTLAATRTLTVTSGLTSLTGNTTGDALNVSNSTSTGNIAVFKDNSTNVLTIADGGAATFRNSVNSTAGFSVLASGGDGILLVDTTNKSVGIGGVASDDSADAALYINGNIGSGNATSLLILQGFGNSAPLLEIFDPFGGSVVAIDSNYNFTTVGNVKGTTINGTTGINTGSGAGTQRITSTGNLVNIGTITSGLINGQTISSSANFTGTLAVKGASVTVGTASSTNGTLVLQNSANAFTTTLTAPNTAGSSKTITLPNETGVVCTTGSICSGYASASSAFIQNGNSFGATAVLGTNDSNTLSFETNNVTQASIAVGGAVLFQNSVDSTTGFRVMDADGGTPVLSVDTDNERVGIGTASPAFSLDVNGTGRMTGGIVGNNTLDGTSFMVSDTNRTLGGTAQTTAVKILGSGASYNNLLHLDNNSTTGRAGMILSASSGGDWANNYLLFAIGGSAHAGNNYFNNIPSKTADAGYSILVNGGSSGTGLLFGTSSNTPLFLGTNNAARMTINSSGNVGIGDLSPASLLTVGSGDLFQVNSSGAIVASTGIANSGGYTQSGSTANTFTGASTFSAAGTALSVTNNATVGGTLTVTQLLTANLGATISGAAINLNASSNFATNINTGTSSGTITLGGGSSPLAINSTAFDVTTGGAVSGVTTLGLSGAISGATATNTINGLIINSGALSGITTISTSSTINSQTISSSANFTGTLAVNGASVTVGTASATNGTLVLQNSANAFTTTLTALNTVGSSKTITLPNENGIVCTTGSVCSGYQASGSYANTALSNLSAVAINTALLPNADNTIDLASLSAGFRTGYLDTSLLTPTVDIGAAGTLSLGNTTATAVTLGRTGITTTNAGALTVSQLLTGSLGATISGAAVSINANSNFATNINTGTSNTLVTIGGGSGTFSLQTTNIDINSVGAISNATGFATTGTVAISGGGTFSIDSSAFDVSTTGALSGITTISTSSTINSQTISSAANFTGTLTVAGANSLSLGTASTNTGSILFKGSGSANTLTLIGPASPSTNTITLPNQTGVVCTTGSVCTGYQATGSYALTSLNNLASVAINTALLPGADNTIDLGSSSFSFRTGYLDTSLLTPAVDVASAGTLTLGVSTATAVTLGRTGITTTNAGALTVTQLLTGNLGATISGAAINLNASSNFATNINTGTSTGAISLGNSAAGAISLQSASTISLTGTTSITGLTSGDALTVSNSSSIGNILVLRDSGTAVLTVADGGSALFRNHTNSTAALQVQNSAGTTNVLTVDTTNVRVGVGVAPSSSGATLQVDGNVSATTGVVLNATGNNNSTITKSTVVTTAVAANDVVVIDNANAGQVRTTTVGGSTGVFGIATTTLGAGQTQNIVIGGIYQVTADATTVSIGDQLITSTTAGQVTPASSPSIGQSIGRALSAKSAGSPGLVWVQVTPGSGGASVNDSNAVGAISAYSGSSAPSGWLLAHGQAVSRTTYSELFAAIGTTYGAGDGSTTFNLPDLRGRNLVGLDNMGGSDAGRLNVANTLGGTGGEQLHTLTIAEMPAHDHPNNSAAAHPWSAVGGTNPEITATAGTRANPIPLQGGGQAHNVMDPYLLTNFIIKATNNTGNSANGNGPQSAKMVRAAAQSIPDATVTKIAFDAEEYDVGDIGDFTTNDRFNIKKSGKYLITTSLWMPNLDATEVLHSYIYKNGSNIHQAFKISTSANNDVQLGSTTTLDLVAGDYIEFYVYHNEGAAQNTYTPVFYRPEMSVVQLDTTGNATTLQGAYDMGRFITTTDARDIVITLADTTTDANLIVNVASGSTSKFAVQYNGADTFSINNAASAQGSAVFKNAANNVAAFQIQNSASLPLLTVDTTNKKLTVATDIVATGSATGTTGTTSGTGNINTTTVILAAAGGFANNDVILVDNTGGSGQDFYTRIVSGGGTTTLTVSPAVSYGTNAGYTGNAAITKYTVQSIGATSTDYATNANKFFQGYFLGGVVTGAGSTTLSDQSLMSTGALYVKTGGENTRLTVTSSGNVGIGTTNPTFGLDVNATARFQSTARFAGTVTESALSLDRLDIGVEAGTPRLVFEDSGSTIWQIDNSGGTFRWFTPGVVRMSINNSGAVNVPGSLTTNSTLTSTGNYFLNNTSPTIILQDSDGRNSAIHQNSNMFYILSGSGTNGTSWTINGGSWPLMINMDNDEAVFGGNIVVGDGGGVEAGYDCNVGNSFCASSWFRSAGDSGWYNGSYGGGIYMADSTYVRTYGSKRFYVDNYIFTSSSLGYANPNAVSGTTACRSTTQIDSAFYLLGHCTSLARYKDEVQNLPYDLNTIRQLRPVKYKWNIDDLSYDIGFIAEEVYAVNPIFNEYSNGAISGVKYDHMVALAIKGIQQLDVQVQTNSTRLSVLEAGNFSGNLQVAGNTNLGGKLTVTGNTTLTNLKVTGTTEVANITVRGKIITAGTTPTVVLGAHAIVGENSTVTVAGNDTAGALTYTAGSVNLPTYDLASGGQAIITFNTAYATAPRIALTPKDSASATVRYYVETTTTGFTIYFLDPPTTSATYTFDYILIQ